MKKSFKNISATVFFTALIVMTSCEKDVEIDTSTDHAPNILCDTVLDVTNINFKEDWPSPVINGTLIAKEVSFTGAKRIPGQFPTASGNLDAPGCRVGYYATGDFFVGSKMKFDILGLPTAAAGVYITVEGAQEYHILDNISGDIVNGELEIEMIMPTTLSGQFNVQVAIFDDLGNVGSPKKIGDELSTKKEFIVHSSQYDGRFVGTWERCLTGMYDVITPANSKYSDVGEKDSYEYTEYGYCAETGKHLEYTATEYSTVNSEIITIKTDGSYTVSVEEESANITFVNCVGELLVSNKSVTVSGFWTYDSATNSLLLFAKDSSDDKIIPCAGGNEVSIKGGRMILGEATSEWFIGNSYIKK